MKMRRGRPEDAIAIAELWFDSWLSTGLDHTLTKAELAERSLREFTGRWEVTVVEANGQLLGFLALAPGEQRLDQLFVAPNAQGGGIGRKLLNFAKERMPDGFWLRTKIGNLRARAFYEREGLILNRIETDDVGAFAFYDFQP